MYICNECVEVGVGLVAGDGGEVQAGQEHVHCSFCDKPLGEVATIIAGPGTNICNECVELCVRIITEGTQADLKLNLGKSDTGRTEIRSSRQWASAGWLRATG